MARGLNRVTLIGNLGQDPELKYTTSGVAVCTFSLATNESWKDKDGQQQDRTEWHSCVAWRKLAELIAEHLKKGDRIYFEGKLQTRSWDDEKTGTKRYKTEIVGDEMLMLGGGKARPAEEPTDLTLPGKEKDDLPF